MSEESKGKEEAAEGMTITGRGEPVVAEIPVKTRKIHKEKHLSA